MPISHATSPADELGDVQFEDSTVMLVADAAPFSTRDVWEGYIDGLQDCGVNVLPYPTFSMLEILSVNLLGSDLLGKAFDIRNGVSAVVFVSGLFFCDQRRWVVESLSRRGMLTALVATDDPYHDLKSPEKVYSIVCTNERACATNGTLYLPTATAVPPVAEPSPFVRDLVFVGTVFEERWELLEKLALHCESNQIRFDILGHLPPQAGSLRDLKYVGVQPTTVSSAQKWLEYQQSRIVLNIFRSPDNHQAVSANPRVYEVGALGRAALLTDHRPEISDEFPDSFYVFDDFEDLIVQLDDALTNEGERMARVANAQRNVLKSHLYQHRAKVLVNAIEKSLVD